MKKKLILGSLILLLVTGAVSFGILKFSYSSGKRAGKLVKLSKKGFLLKTYEGTLDLGSGDALTWNFSIHNDELAQKLQQQNGRMVVLEYRELLWKLFFDTKYDVTNWKNSDPLGGGSQLLCRFVKVLRNDSSVVEKIRPMILQHDASLLDEIRDCQTNQN
ncbi:MAG: hypothetical protein HN509_00425 [Halobacteriovoraceae bacterium]|jgi:hypothetical protein|nr:hypothetical protein [Halobacteriovoraceae bacterium]MBT5094099.1 hypothetical protein [Halobacteriovoraceae bacterium]